MSPAPLYTRDFVTACLIHLAGALSLAMWMLQPLYVRALGGTEVTIGLVLGVSTATSVAAMVAAGLPTWMTCSKSCRTASVACSAALATTTAVWG